MSYCAKKLEAAKAFRAYNVQGVGELIQKLIKTNKLYEAYEVQRITDEQMVNIVLNNCEGKMQSVAVEAPSKIREREVQMNVAGA